MLDPSSADAFGSPLTFERSFEKRNATSVFCAGAKFAPPLKSRSRIEVHRRARALCSPSTHRIASETLLFPQPLGPTMVVMPGSSINSTSSAKLLNPRIFMLFKCKGLPLPPQVQIISTMISSSLRHSFKRSLASQCESAPATLPYHEHSYNTQYK